jgi:hypothetical protein
MGFLNNLIYKMMNEERESNFNMSETTRKSNYKINFSEVGSKASGDLGESIKCF